MIEFTQLPTVVGRQVWGAGVFPWTFVITTNGSGHYVASARDARDPLQVQPRNNLGHDFKTLDDAQAACNAFLKKGRV